MTIYLKDMFLSAYYVPGTVLGAGIIIVSKNKHKSVSKSFPVEEETGLTQLTTQMKSGDLRRWSLQFYEYIGEKKLF